MFRATNIFVCVFALAACITAAAPQSHAATVFSDGSENSAVGGIPATTDPTIGEWDFHHNTTGSSIVLTRSGATPDGPSAAYSGSNYFQIGRGPANEVAQVGAVFDSPVDVTTTSLHVEFRAFFKQAVTNGVSFGFEDVYEYISWGSQSNTLVPIIFGDNSGVAQTNLWYWNGGPDFVQTTEVLIDNAWNEVTMDWNHATQKFTVGINGDSWEAPTVWGTASSISRLQIFPSWNAGNIFLDNISITTGGPPTAVPGDFDADGDVDGADFVVWQTNFPTATDATLADGDADGDGDVDGADFVVWQTNFPTTPSSGIATVPEPMSFVLLIAGGLVTLAWRHRSRSQRKCAS